ncbi:MAG: hypothetical protein JNG84_10570, partial [Archangium sp.]|nr:hypothetical protein [Archangium sp.]
MRPRRLGDVRELVASPEFRGWWQELVDARDAVTAAEARHEDLLVQLALTEFRAELTQKNAIDTLYRAGEHEDEAARLLAESTELENRSFPGVASFEEQRFRVSELWYRLGAAERELDDAKERTPPAGDVQALERRHRVMAEEYERELTRRNRLWDDVENLWTRSAEVNLMTCEARVLGRKVRRSAERLFGLAEERKKNTQALRAETDGSASAVEGARAKLATVRARAKELFGCSVGTDFIYFRHRDDQRHAFAIALVDDREAYNLE